MTAARRYLFGVVWEYVPYPRGIEEFCDGCLHEFQRVGYFKSPTGRCDTSEPFWRRKYIPIRNTPYVLCTNCFFHYRFDQWREWLKGAYPEMSEAVELKLQEVPCDDPELGPYQEVLLSVLFARYDSKVRALEVSA